MKRSEDAMRDLIILGTGIHGAEMAEMVERVNTVTPRWNLRGHLAPTSERAKALGGSFHGQPVLGTAEDVGRFPDADLVIDNEFPRSPTPPLDRLVSLIDPSAVVSRRATIGRGCVLYPGCFVGLNARLGDMVFCLSGATINHDDVIEDRVVLCTGVTLAGCVHVEPDCYLGQACTVRQFLRIGQGSMVGMGAVVVKNVAPNSVVVGNPARYLRPRRPV